MSETSPGRDVSSLRVAGLKLVTIVSALCVLGVFLFVTGLAHYVLRSAWVVRAVVVLLAAGYVGYTLWILHPRLPRVTAADTDPTSARVYRSAARLSRRVGIPIPQVVIDPSPEANAVTFGLSPSTAYIVVYDGFLRCVQDDEELDAALAHEMSHIVNRDCIAATSMNFVILVAKGFYRLAEAVLSLGAAGGRIMAGMVAVFLSGGLIGLLVFALLAFFVMHVMMYAAVMAAAALAVLVLALLAVNAFQRQRERLADDFAARMVGPEAVARLLVRLSEADPGERRMACQLIGLSPQSDRPLPVADVVEKVRGTPMSFTLAAHVQEFLAPHPLTLRRARRVLAGSEDHGLLERLLAPLARRIERSAPWMTPEAAALASAPSGREGPLLIFGAAAGLLSALAAALLPSVGATVAWFALGLPIGLVLGIGTALLLIRKGPFRGADVIDAALTSCLGWFVLAAGVSAGLLLHNYAVLVGSCWVVLLVSFATAVLGYAAIPPDLGGARERPAASAEPPLPPEPPEPEPEEVLPLEPETPKPPREEQKGFSFDR